MTLNSLNYSTFFCNILFNKIHLISIPYDSLPNVKNEDGVGGKEKEIAAIG